MEEKNINNNITNSSKSTIIMYVVVGIVALALGFGVGFYTGKIQGKKAINKSLEVQNQYYKSIVDIAYPQPPEEIFEISGKVLSKGDSYLIIETVDPNDYLPHPDNSPRKTMERKVKIGNNTKLRIIDYSKLSATGRPLSYDISPDNINVGDVVLVKSDKNIKNTVEFTPSEILMSKI